MHDELFWVNQLEEPNCPLIKRRRRASECTILSLPLSLADRRQRRLSAPAAKWEKASVPRLVQRPPVVEGKCGPENTTKIRVPEAGMEVEMLAGHARALKQEEVL